MRAALLKFIPESYWYKVLFSSNLRKFSNELKFNTFEEMVEANSLQIIIPAGVFGIFTLIETFRYQRHLYHLRRIPHRIHVNGSRGKSSVTRLIGAALRDKMKTVVKTTGTSARFIYPDGKEIPIFRPGKPNIIEQIKVVRKAAQLGADALVVECMAITPDYIRILEEKLIRSTVGVITNVREDHLDVMGPTVEHVAYNIALSLPYNGVAFTAEDRWFPVLEKVARSRGTRLIRVSADDISDEEMQGFSYLEHKENVALALAVAMHLGIDRKEALMGMYKVNPDPGALREIVLNMSGRRVYFLNAMAANDVESTIRIWKMALNRHPNSYRIALLILRKDRPQRTESFARVMGRDIIANLYILAGSMTSFVEKALLKRGVPPQSIVNLEGGDADLVIRTIEEKVKDDSLIVAMGNIVGLGQEILNKLEEMA